MSYVRPARTQGALLSWPAPTSRGWTTDGMTPPIVQGAIQWITISLGGAYLQITAGSVLYATAVALTHIMVSFEGPYSQTGVVNEQAPGFLPAGFRPNVTLSRSLTLSNGQTMPISFNPNGSVIFYRPTGSSLFVVTGSGFFQWWPVV